MNPLVETLDSQIRAMHPATRDRTKPTDSEPARLSAPEFADQFREAFRTLWLLAISIVHDAALAEDVVQEAATIAYQKLDQFRAETSFVAWMGAIVRNVAMNRARKQRRDRSVPMDPVSLERFGHEAGANCARRAGTCTEEVGTPDYPAEATEVDRRVAEALGDVAETARACLLLRTLCGMEYSMISRLLEIPEGTAMSHVHRARRYLRERLADLDQDGSSVVENQP
jgi:RNA polymerase sigma-70 factor (ECF subfamily)